MPSIMASVAPVSSSTPIQSKLRRVISRGSGSQRAASHRAATPVGTASQKMADQENMSSNMPPRLGATAGASTMPKPRMPDARPCSCGWNKRITASVPSGCITPAATPCRIRTTTMPEKPIHEAPSAPASELASSSAEEPRNSLRKPMRSSNHGAGNMPTAMAAMKPVMVHCACSCPMP